MVAMVPSLQAICLETLARALWRGDDVDLQRLPELIAVQLLRLVLAVDDGRLGRALAVWSRRRPPFHLRIAGPEMCRSLSFLPNQGLIEVFLSHMPELTDSQLSRLLLKSCQNMSLKILQLQDCPLLMGQFIADISQSFPTRTRPSLQRLLCCRCTGLLDDFVCRGLPPLHLTHLSLSGSVHLTDAVVSCVSGGVAPAPLPQLGMQLEHLDLSQTKVSDQGVSTLVRLPSVSVLMLSRTTSVTSQCLRQLSTALGLRALLPDRPRVFLRNFRAAQTLSALSEVTAPVLEANKLLPALQSGEAWSEEAIRHAVAVLHLTTVDVNKEQVGPGSIKRPTGEFGFNPPDWKRLRGERKKCDFSHFSTKIIRPLHGENNTHTDGYIYIYIYIYNHNYIHTYIYIYIYA